MRGLLLAGGLGLLAYYYFSKQPGGISSLFGSSGTAGPPIPPTTGGTATPPAPTQTTPPAPAFTSLAAIYSRLAASAQGNQQLNPYQWNYYLGQQYSGAQPDTLAGITDWTLPIPLNVYWSAASQWLAANAGLSGLGWAV